MIKISNDKQCIFFEKSEHKLHKSLVSSLPLLLSNVGSPRGPDLFMNEPPLSCHTENTQLSAENTLAKALPFKYWNLACYLHSLSGSLIVALFTHLSFSVFCYYFVPVTSRGFLLNTGGPFPVKRRGKNLEILCPPQPTVACGQCASAGGLKPSWVSSGVNTKQRERSG